MSEPNLKNSLVDGLPLPGYAKSILGFFADKKMLEPAVVTALIDKVALGDTVKETAVGSAVAAGLEKMGMPTWLSVLGGVSLSSMPKHPMLGMAGLLVTGVMGIFEMMKGGLHMVESMGHHQTPSLTQ